VKAPEAFYELHGLQTVQVFFSREELIRKVETEPLSLFMRVFHVPLTYKLDGSSRQGVIRITGNPVEVPIEDVLA